MLRRALRAYTYVNRQKVIAVPNGRAGGPKTEPDPQVSISADPIPA